MKVFIFLSVFHAFWCTPAHAWPPTFGPEFEFSSPELRKNFQGGKIPSEADRSVTEKFAQLVREKCAASKDCEENISYAKRGKEPRFTFADGWWFQVSFDPGGPEILAKPQTLEQIKANVGRMNEYIFGVAKAAGLDFVHDGIQTTVGHFNVGAQSAFGDDARAMLAFLADYANRPELAAGIFGEDFPNAPPMAMLKDEQRAEFVAIMREVREGKLKGLSKLAEAIQSRVYTWSPIFEASHHYQAIGLKQMNRYGFPKEDRPFEYRAMRMQESAEEFERLAELTQIRIEYVKAQGSPLVYLPDVEIKFKPEEHASRFYVYLQEMNASWEKFAPVGGFKGNEKMDSFVKGPVDWKNPKFREAALAYAEDTIISPWLRERMLTALADPGALKTGAGLEILEKIAALERYAADQPELAERVKALLTRAGALQDWAKGSSERWKKIEAKIGGARSAATCGPGYGRLVDREKR